MSTATANTLAEQLKVTESKKKQRRCPNCDELGHFSKTCPQPQRILSSQQLKVTVEVVVLVAPSSMYQITISDSDSDGDGDGDSGSDSDSDSAIDSNCTCMALRVACIGVRLSLAHA